MIRVMCVGIPDERVGPPQTLWRSLGDSHSIYDKRPNLPALFQSAHQNLERRGERSPVSDKGPQDG